MFHGSSSRVPANRALDSPSEAGAVDVQLPSHAFQEQSTVGLVAFEGRYRTARPRASRLTMHTRHPVDASTGWFAIVRLTKCLTRLVPSAVMVQLSLVEISS
jgi:hypothetical protein